MAGEPDFIDYAELTRRLRAALVAAVRDFAEGRLVGLALMNDNDMGPSAGLVACSEAERNDANRFGPVDWEHCPDPADMSLVRELLAVRSEREDLEDSDYRTQDDRVWAAQRAAFVGLREELGLADDVFLAVLMADGCAEEFEASVEALNPPAVVRTYRTRELRDAEKWLARLEAKPEPRSYADDDNIANLRAEIAQLRAKLA